MCTVWDREHKSRDKKKGSLVLPVVAGERWDVVQDSHAIFHYEVMMVLAQPEVLMQVLEQFL